MCVGRVCILCVCRVYHMCASHYVSGICVVCVRRACAACVRHVYLVCASRMCIVCVLCAPRVSCVNVLCAPRVSCVRIMCVACVLCERIMCFACVLCERIMCVACVFGVLIRCVAYVLVACYVRSVGLPDYQPLSLCFHPPLLSLRQARCVARTWPARWWSITPPTSRRWSTYPPPCPAHATRSSWATSPTPTSCAA